MEYTRRNILKTISGIAGVSLLPLSGQTQSIGNDTSNRLNQILTTDPEDLDDLINLFDFELKAEKLMSKMAWEFVVSGVADEITVKWNREAFDKIKIQTNVLKDVSKVDTKVSIFEQEIAYPILIAPTSNHKIIHPDGEIATARRAGLAFATFVVSSSTTTTIEEIARVATQPLWFQLYFGGDKTFVKDLVQKVEEHGVKALCLTVDLPVRGVRNREERVKFQLPPGMENPYRSGTEKALSYRKSVTWKDIEWLKSISKMPILLKGILNPNDAEQAIKSGAAGIIVSNHGGRSLDSVPATIEALPYITRQVKKRIPVLMDGGIRRGTDIVKAIAFGADAVLVGRPVCFGLACGGAQGVAKVLKILKEELQIAMALIGVTSIAGINKSLIWKGTD